MSLFRCPLDWSKSSELKSSIWHAFKDWWFTVFKFYIYMYICLFGWAQNSGPVQELEFLVTELVLHPRLHAFKGEGENNNTKGILTILM